MAHGVFRQEKGIRLNVSKIRDAGSVCVFCAKFFDEKKTQPVFYARQSRLSVWTQETLQEGLFERLLFPPS